MICSICRKEEPTTRPRISGNDTYRVCESCWDDMWDERVDGVDDIEFSEDG